MLRFCQNTAEAMRSSVKHTPILLSSKVEECRLSLKQIQMESDMYRFVSKVSTVLLKRKAAFTVTLLFSIR